MQCCDELTNSLGWLDRVRTGREIITATGSLPVSIAWARLPNQYMAANYEPETKIILVSGTMRDQLVAARLIARELQLSRHYLQFGTINPQDSLDTYTARRIMANLDAEAVAATVAVELAWQGSYQAVHRAVRNPESSDIYRKIEPLCWKFMAHRAEVYNAAIDAFLGAPFRVGKLVHECRHDWEKYDVHRDVTEATGPTTRTNQKQQLPDTYKTWVNRVSTELSDLKQVSSLYRGGHDR